MYSETISETEAYLTLKKSMVINIMDFNIITETDKYHTEYRILEKDVESMEAIELWLTFIKNAGGESSMDELMNKLSERSEALKMANEMLKEISPDKELREEYYAREKARLDRESSLYYAKE